MNWIGYLLSLGGLGFWAFQAGMTIWMLVDVATSNSDFYWFYLIFFFQPLGTWIYFFAVKLQDFTARGRGPLWTRRVSVDQLRYNLRSNPCVSNKLALANRLLDSGELSEAQDLYQQSLKFDDTSKEALFGLGRVQLAQDQSTAGLATLQQLLKLEPSYRDHQAAEITAQAQWKAGYRTEAIAALEVLVRKHPRFNLMTTLARFLADAGRQTEARELVLKALDDFRHSPRYIKRMNRGWPREAKQLLSQLPAG